MSQILIEELDNIIKSLNESMPQTDKIKIATVARDNIDSNVEEDIDWSELDNKWNKLVELILDRTNMSGNAKLTYYVADGAKDKNGNEITDNYLQWSGDAKQVTLVPKDQATIATNTSPLFKKSLNDALHNDEKTKDITYDKLTTVTDTIKKFNDNEGTTLPKLIDYYYNKFTGKEYNDVPNYWKRAIENDIANTRNITNSKVLLFIIQAGETKLNDKTVLECLNTDIINRITWTLLDENTLDANRLKNVEDLFLLAALYSGCFNDLEYFDVLQHFETFKNLEDKYTSNPNIISEKVTKRINSDDVEMQANILAQNLILHKKDEEIKNNPILVAFDEGLPSAEEIQQNGIPKTINQIDTRELEAYIGASKAEVTGILNRIINSAELEKIKDDYWLISDKKMYPLTLNKENKTLNSSSPIKLFERNIIRVVKSKKYNVEEAQNLLKGNNINSLIEYNLSEEEKKNGIEFKAEDYFGIQNNEIYPKGNYSFNNISIKLKEDNNKKLVIEKLILGTLPQKFNVSNKVDDKEKDNSSDKKDSNNIDEDQYKEAITKYLIENKTEKLDTDNKVKTFMWTKQTPEYENMKDAVVHQLKTKPKAYLYDEKTNTIGNVENTLLQVLVYLLDDEMDKAKQQMETVKNNGKSKNISDYIEVNHNKLKAPKATAKEIATKLQNLATILNNDNSNAVNKIDSKVKKEIDKEDLAKVISWLDSRFAKGNQVKTKKENK